jgi:hypothetical protein
LRFNLIAMLKIVGRIAIPRVAKRGLDQLLNRGGHLIPSYGIADMSLRDSDYCVDDLGDEARRRLIFSIRQSLESSETIAKYRCGMDRAEGSVLLFRNVAKHKDTGNEFRLFVGDSDTRSVRSATLNAVLRGTSRVHLYKNDRITKTIELRAGDVYVLDQAVDHAVTNAKRTCAHLSIAMTLSGARRTRGDPKRILRPPKASKGR